MVSWAYHQNAFVPLDQVSIALNDVGFAMGVTVTDQCRTYGQRPFRLQDHLNRFARSCQLCGVHCPVTLAELEKIIGEVLERNVQQSAAGVDWSIVWLATPGEVGSFLGQPGTVRDAKPRLTVYGFPVDHNRFEQFERDGVELRIPKTVTSPAGTVVHPHAKQRSRLHWWLAEGTVKHTHPHAQALLLDGDGYVTECASSNFLMVKRGEVFSPRRSRILPGVSLLVVEELCRENGIRFIEGDLREDDLEQAEEAFVSSTPFGIAPVGNLCGRQLALDGAVYGRLQSAWQRMVQRFIADQVKSGRSGFVHRQQCC